MCLSVHLFCQVHVNGYYRKNGTYVEPHYRSVPNSTKSDNYSTIGNTNPYTGKAGTVNPYGGNSNYHYGSETGSYQTYAPNGVVVQSSSGDGSIGEWINYGIGKIISHKKKSQVKNTTTPTDKGYVKHTKFEYYSSSFSLKKDGDITETISADIKITIDIKNNFILFESDLGAPIKVEIISRKKAGENEVIFNVNDTGIDAVYYMEMNGTKTLAVFPTSNSEPTSFYNNLKLISKS